VLQSRLLTHLSYARDKIWSRKASSEKPASAIFNTLDFQINVPGTIYVQRVCLRRAVVFYREIPGLNSKLRLVEFLHLRIEDHFLTTYVVIEIKLLINSLKKTRSLEGAVTFIQGNEQSCRVRLLFLGLFPWGTLVLN